MKVQLLAVTADADGFRGRFAQALKGQCAILGIALTIREVQAAVTNDTSMKGGVTLVFAAAGDRWPGATEAWLRQRVDAGDPVLPVIDRPQDASGLPSVLAPINAFVRGRQPRGVEVDALVDEVLGITWLRRRKRKVFVSYRRTDSEALARQLFARFAALGYDVFLDDASIEPGLDFQRELKGWLNDADLVLALVSPNFSNSRWCMEEIAFAQAQSVGVLGVHWPQAIYGPAPTLAFPGFTAGGAEPAVAKATTPDQQVRLTSKDFAQSRRAGATLADAVLTPAATARVLAACARQRTLALRQRMDNLILQAASLLPARGRVRPGRDFGDLRFTDTEGRPCFVRTLPFRPGPEHVREAFDARGRASVAGCLYAEFERADDARGGALRWLANGPRGAAASQIWAVCGGALL